MVRKREWAVSSALTLPVDSDRMCTAPSSRPSSSRSPLTAAAQAGIGQLARTVLTLRSEEEATSQMLTCTKVGGPGEGAGRAGLAL